MWGNRQWRSWTDRYWTSADGLQAPLSRLCRPARPAADPVHPGPDPQRPRFRAGRRALCRRVAGDRRRLARPRAERIGSRTRPATRRATYVADMLKLLDQLGIADAVFFGTSLGGIVHDAARSTDAERIAGAMLNDIGPEIDHVGHRSHRHLCRQGRRLRTGTRQPRRSRAATAIAFPD